MKSVSKFVALLTFVAAFGATASSAHAGMCDETGFPRERYIQARDVCATHTINHPVVAEAVLDTVIHFDTASSKVPAHEEGKLKAVAALLKSPSMKGAHVSVQGFTDNKGKDATNQRLSYHRAVAVMQTLVKKYGVPASMLSAQGFGKENPVADNTTAVGRAANRRVGFVVTK